MATNLDELKDELYEAFTKTKDSLRFSSKDYILNNPNTTGAGAEVAKAVAELARAIVNVEQEITNREERKTGPKLPGKA